MKKILVIEDEPEMRRNITTILRFESAILWPPRTGGPGSNSPKAKARRYLVRRDDAELDGYGVLQALRDDPDLVNTPFIFLTAKGEKADVRSGMDLGADDYLSKPVVKADLLNAIESRLKRQAQKGRQFKPNFGSPQPLLSSALRRGRRSPPLGAQGKTNADIATILGISESTVKKHMLEVFEVLGVETRSAAALRALEVLSSPPAKSRNSTV
jgi:DNA-binding NarL/FixJ family response regulator